MTHFDDFPLSAEAEVEADELDNEAPGLGLRDKEIVSEVDDDDESEVGLPDQEDPVEGFSEDEESV